MKKILVALLFLGFAGVSRADSTTMFDLGSVKVYIPLTSVDTVYQYDFVTKTSLVGAETPIANWKIITVTGGAVTSLDGQGTPFLGARLDLVNPMEPYVPVAAIHPGLFAGRNFRENSWIYGLKFGVNIF